MSAATRLTTNPTPGTAARLQQPCGTGRRACHRPGSVAALL